MSDQSPDRARDAALWRQARRDLGESLGGAAAPEEGEAALLIAGYLDGSLDEAARARVEAWLASDAAALDLLLQSRAALAEAPAVVPAVAIERAQGLVRPALRISGSTGLAGLFAPLRALWQPAGLAAAAACLLACVAGFELGRAGDASVVASEYLLAQQDVGFDLHPAADDLL